MRRVHSPEFKARVALDALQNNEQLAQVAARYSLHPVQVCQWKNHLINSANKLFQAGLINGNLKDVERHSRPVLRQVERLEMELVWLREKLFRLSFEVVD